MYYLMIKEIEQTGLKYLCKRKQSRKSDDHISYKGSGKLWRRILNAHPEYTIKTTVLGLYDRDDLYKYGLYYSNLYKIVESDDWANLMPEQGDGGITHANTHPYINEATGDITYRTECPINYRPYYNKQRPCRVIHNPETGQIKKITPSAATPPGWQDGGMKGKFSYGPRKNQTRVYHNGQRKIYVKIGDTVPDGFVPGVHYPGITKDRIGCHNPYTLEKRYLLPGEPIPPGFVKGLLPTTGLRIECPQGKFDSIAGCMRATGLTRYAIEGKLKDDPRWRKIKER